MIATAATAALSLLAGLYVLLTRDIDEGAHSFFTGAGLLVFGLTLGLFVWSTVYRQTHAMRVLPADRFERRAGR